LEESEEEGDWMAKQCKTILFGAKGTALMMMFIQAAMNSGVPLGLSFNPQVCY